MEIGIWVELIFIHILLVTIAVAQHIEPIQSNEPEYCKYT